MWRIASSIRDRAADVMTHGTADAGRDRGIAVVSRHGRGAKAGRICARELRERVLLLRLVLLLLLLLLRLVRRRRRRSVHVCVAIGLDSTVLLLCSHHAPPS
jgi:hypothetical protein